MSEQVAETEAAAVETSAAEETGGNENASQSTSDNGQVDNSEGLLKGGSSETAPDFTGDPVQNADPSKAPSTVKRPVDIPEPFWDSIKGEVKAETLAQSYNDIRKQNGMLLKKLDSKGEAPENAEDYLKDYTPPHRSRPSGDQKEGDTLERFGDLDASDPMIAVMAKAAKNANLSKGQFDDFMQDVMEGIHPILPEPFSAEKEMGLLGENGKHLVDTNRSWIDRLASRGVLNEKQYNLMLQFGATAEGVLLTNALRMDNGEKPIPVNASVATGKKTPDECAAMMNIQGSNGKLLKDEDTPAGQAHRDAMDKEFALTHGTDKA